MFIEYIPCFILYFNVYITKVLLNWNISLTKGLKKMAVIGYIRVSSNKQTLQHQKHEILLFAKDNNFVVNKWVMETVSSRQPLQKRELGRVLDELQPKES